jgi:plastocyanin
MVRSTVRRLGSRAVLDAFIVLAGAATGLGFAGSALASGGGGCGRPVTDARGTTVVIRNFCFTPTVLHARLGQTVTWINRDEFPHTVSGANAAYGSYRELAQDEKVTYRFNRSGVYPYVCLIHPGMTGAIVVGTGSAPGAAKISTIQTEAVTLMATAPSPLPPPPVRLAALRPAASAMTVREAGVLIGFGFALALTLALSIQWRFLTRRHATAAANEENAG